MKESEILTVILQYLKAEGILAWRQNQGMLQTGNRFIRFSHQKGISDIIGILPDGRFLAIEVKTRRGRLRKSQTEFIGLIRERGGVAFVARSVADVERQLEEAGICTMLPAQIFDRQPA